MEPKPTKLQTSSDTDDVAEVEKKVSTDCTDDFGLRRRQVSPLDGRRRMISGDFHHHGVIESYGKLSDEYDRFKGTPERSEQHGGASRIILQDNMDEQRIPHKLKKSKSSKYSYTPFVHVREVSSEAVEQPVARAPRKGLSIIFKKGWITGDTVRHDEKAYFLFAMRDFILFIIFLTLVCFAAYGPRPRAYNYYAVKIREFLGSLTYQSFIGEHEVLSDLFSTHSISQMWSFIYKVAVPSIALSISGKLENCYDYYTGSNEDKEPFGNINSSPWRYNFDTQSITVHVEIGYYGGGGYQFNMTKDLRFLVISLKELEALQWIRLGARAVIIEMTLFTPNTNLFLVIKWVFELLPSGGIIVRSHWIPLKLIKYLIPYDLFVMSCEFMVILFTFYYTFEELQQIYELREEYFANLWNILDLTIIVLSYCTICLGIRSQYLTRKLLITKLEGWRSEAHVNFDDLLDAEQKFLLCQSFFTFAVFLKLFKFTPLFKSVAHIMAAFEKIRSELITVVFMSFILISGFALCGMCLFGAHVKDFFRFRRAAFSLISMYAGSFEFYNDCRRVYPTLAQIYFSVYILMSVVIFFSLYVALVVHGYHCADVYMQQRPDRQYFGDLVRATFIEILTFFHKLSFIEKLERRAMISQNQEDYDAFVRILRRHGCRELELKLLMNKYHFDRGNFMTLDKMTELYNDLCSRKMLFVEVEDHNSVHEHLDKIDKMFEFCDQAIVDIMTKLDYLSKSIHLVNRKLS